MIFFTIVPVRAILNQKKFTIILTFRYKYRLNVSIQENNNYDTFKAKTEVFLKVITILIMYLIIFSEKIILI